MSTTALARLRSWPLGRRAAIVAGLAVLAVATVLSLGPIRQDAAYYGVADARAFLGIPNALDVLSNLPFALAGLLGLARRRRLAPALRGIGTVLFTAFVAVAIGSTWYHLEPTPARLLADRLPITLAFMALFALVIGDRISPRAGRAALLPLVALGAGTALLWYLGGARPGGGNLGPYALTQALPMALLPALLVLFEGELDERRLAAAFGLYLLAKLFELVDAPLFELGGVVSGHTLKHLAAAAACFCLLPGAAREPRSAARAADPPQAGARDA